MPELPKPGLPEPILIPFDPAEVERHREERERHEEVMRRLRSETAWFTTGWGAVGVPWCGRCANHFEGAAYVYDTPWGREYYCTKCVGRRRWALPTPRPCVVCGREFTWVSGQGPRVERGESIPVSQLRSLPRPRVHICSDTCRRERRNRRRRVRREHVCAECGETFVSKRADAVYCSAACRQRAYRRRQREAASK